MPKTRNTTWYRNFKKENSKLLGEIFNQNRSSDISSGGGAGPSEGLSEGSSCDLNNFLNRDQDILLNNRMQNNQENSYSFVTVNFQNYPNINLNSERDEVRKNDLLGDNLGDRSIVNLNSDSEGHEVRNNNVLGDSLGDSSVVGVDIDNGFDISTCNQVAINQRQYSVQEKLKNWAISNNITHSALDGLLHILSNASPKDNFSGLPKTSRTFLMTPTKLLSKKVEPGEYYHFGIQASLEFLLKKQKTQLSFETLEIGVNIDGLPLAKSSTSQVYPILGVFLPTKEVFMIGIYHGYEKPKDFNVFLSDFVYEACYLTTNGIIIFEKMYSFKISMYLFDAVAKASVLFVKGHSGYSSCTKCTQEGDYIKDRICFPELHFIKRTHEQFVNQTDSDYHKGRTVLLDIPDIDIISDVPLDYMHLVALGVVKKLLCGLWCYGTPPHKLSAAQIKSISKKLADLSLYIPSEFARRPRSLNEVKRWKATEFRQFLLYTGPVVLKTILSKKKYSNFLTLTVSITLLLNNKLNKEYLNYAESLLIYFVKGVKDIYGNHLLSHNFHNLLHLADDVRKFGSLENFSNFPCENFLQSLLKLVRKHHNPLQQIVRRYYETCNNNGLNSNTNMQKNINLKKICFKNFKLSANSTRDSCCVLKDGSIVFIQDIVFSMQQKPVEIIGKKYKSISSFFNFPCSSSLLEIFFVRELIEMIYHWPVDDIDYKAVRLPSDDGFVIFPLVNSKE